MHVVVTFMKDSFDALSFVCIHIQSLVCGVVSLVDGHECGRAC